MSLEIFATFKFWEVSAICMLHSVLVYKYQENTDMG